MHAVGPRNRSYVCYLAFQLTAVVEELEHLKVALLTGQFSDSSAAAAAIQTLSELYIPSPGGWNPGQRRASDAGVRVASIAAIVDRAVQHKSGSLTIVGGLGQHFAGNLARSMADRDVHYRFVFPSSAVEFMGGHSAEPAHLRMRREGEFKTLTEWQKGISLQDGSSASPSVPSGIAIDCYVSDSLDNSCFIHFSAPGEPDLVAYWPEGIAARLNDDGECFAVVVDESSPAFRPVQHQVESILRDCRPYVQHEIVATATPFEPVAPPGYPGELTRKLVSRLGEPGSGAENDDGLAVALGVLYAVGPQCRIFLQHRTRANSRDSFDRRALVSTRLYASDLLSTFSNEDGESLVSLRPEPIEKIQTSTEATRLLYDRTHDHYGAMDPGRPKLPIPLEAFRRAIRRECYSSLGLELAVNRVVHIPLPDRLTTVRTSERTIYAEVFAVRLLGNEAEVDRMRIARPFADIRPYRWPDDVIALEDGEVAGFLAARRTSPEFRACVDSLFR